MTKRRFAKKHTIFFLLLLLDKRLFLFLATDELPSEYVVELSYGFRRWLANVDSMGHAEISTNQPVGSAAKSRVAKYGGLASGVVWTSGEPEGG